MTLYDFVSFPYLTIWIFIIGLCLGSFFNVLADRLADNTWPTGRSKCDYCGRVLDWMMLIPVVSYAMGKAKSMCCGKKLSIWYPFSEIFTGVVYVCVWQVAGLKGWTGLEIVVYYIIASSCIVISIADMKYHIIPDLMTLLCTISAAALILPFGLQSVAEHTAGGLLLFGLLYILYAATRGKGMGFGDVKFAFPMGLLLGPIHGFLALYVSFMIGGLYGILALMSGSKKLKSTIAFGPFLIIGTVVMVVWGEQVRTFLFSFLS